MKRYIRQLLRLVALQSEEKTESLKSKPTAKSEVLLDRFCEVQFVFRCALQKSMVQKLNSSWSFDWVFFQTLGDEILKVCAPSAV